MSRINTLREKEKLFDFLIARLESLKKKEAESGEMLPETRETVVCLYNLLEKLRIEEAGRWKTWEERKEEVERLNELTGIGEFKRLLNKEKGAEEDG